MTYVPFDLDFAEIGLIEPEFVQELIGWANEEIVRNAGMEPVAQFGVEHVVTWIPNEYARRPLPEPIPQYKRTLKWKRTEY